ncbi:uncharacterized protein PSFLO_01326 [Pseudozyma flocculosa]|uniref:Uncharacterized protein n=1 Tax=Pseudozyma flocculosa TaxID=84751 RepID=A0A5C3EVT1_9BASI|nr:uncharacterized protein PSFLO_01326 [Pseudozyma flocculosa]
MSQQPSATTAASAPPDQVDLRDDSSARRYAKTSHLGQRRNDYDTRYDHLTPAERAEALKAAANEELESTAEFRRARALTADNLERIPDADQLAPGIRLPGQGVDPRGDRHHGRGDHDNDNDNDNDLPTSSTDADGAALSLETGDTSVGNFGEGGAPVPGVPPELDPRTAAFRPHSPGAASVFSVAVQPPGSPKPQMVDISEPASPFPETRSSATVSGASATAGSSYSASARGSSPPLSAGFAPTDAAAYAGRLAPGPSGLSRTVASVAPSEAGSISSSGTGGGQGSTGTADDQELALRAAYIERQRMREREIMGGEAGVGGTSLPVFPPRGSTPLAFAPGLSSRLGQGPASRAGSTAATIGTASPPPSLDGSEIPDGVASPSRRGSVDSTETLGSIRAPPSIPGFDMVGGAGTGGGSGGVGGGIDSRRMSRGGSSIGMGDADASIVAPARRGSEAGLVDQAMDEDVEGGSGGGARPGEDDEAMPDSAAEMHAKAGQQ